MSSTDTSSKTYTQEQMDMIIAEMRTQITTDIMKQLAEEKPKKIRKARKATTEHRGDFGCHWRDEEDQKWIDMMVEHGAKFRQPSNDKEYGDIKKAGGKGATYFHSAKEALIFLAKEKNWKKHHNCAIVQRKNQVKGEDFGKIMWGIRKATLAKFHDEDDEKVMDAPYTQGGTLWIGWGFKSDEFAGVKSKQELRDDFKEFVDMINGGAEATISDDGATTTEDDATSEEEEVEEVEEIEEGVARNKAQHESKKKEEALLKVNGTNETTQFKCNLQPPTITPTDYEHTITLRDNTITQLQTHITQMELQHIEERRLATSRLNELIEVKALLLEETDERLFLQQKLDSSTINLQQLRQQVRLAQHNYKY